jgi:hypothetical protein
MVETPVGRREQWHSANHRLSLDSELDRTCIIRWLDGGRDLMESVSILLCELTRKSRYLRVLVPRSLASQ